MKFRIERDTFADAVAWTARSLPGRPTAPVLGGMLHEVDGGTLTLSGFDYEVSAQAQVEVHGTCRPIFCMLLAICTPAGASE